MKNLASNCLLVECQNKKDSETLANELKKVNEVSLEQPKKNLPTLLLKYVPLSVADEAFKDTILHQNNLTHLAVPVLNVKFRKKSFHDSRHVVIEVSPEVRREMIALNKLKMHWSICTFEDFIIISRCFTCLGFGHLSKYCNGQQKCSNCAGDHHWKECVNQSPICCYNCQKANSYIKNLNKKLGTNHCAIIKECPRLNRIQNIIINKTEYRTKHGYSLLRSLKCPSLQSSHGASLSSHLKPQDRHSPTTRTILR